MFTYAYLTHHIVPGPQSISYFVPITLLPIALLIPPTRLSRWQSICLFMPLMVASTLHAWIQMRGVDVISVDVLLWAFYLLVLKDPWNDFRYVGSSSRKQNDASAQYEVMEEGLPYPPTMTGRLSWVVMLLASMQLQGWRIGKHSHDVLQKPVHRTTARASFAKQALLSFIRGYIILDLACAYQTSDRYFTDLNTTISSPLPFSEPTGLLRPRLFRACIMGTQVWALISQFIYTPCLILVSLNALHRLPDEWSPHAWPPLFGDPSVVLNRGIRGFWGQYWHQAMRVFTSAPGEAVGDLLRLKQRSLARYVLVITMAFGLSGIIHMGLVPPEPLYASQGVNEIRLHVAEFFWLQPVAIMFEICAMRIVSLGVSLQSFDRGVRKALKMVVNLVWVVVWFNFCLPVFGEATRQLGYWRVYLVPVSLWRGLGGQGWIAWE